jgi:hypothetical protein
MAQLLNFGIDMNKGIIGKTDSYYRGLSDYECYQIMKLTVKIIAGEYYIRFMDKNNSTKEYFKNELNKIHNVWDSKQPNQDSLMEVVWLEMYLAHMTKTNPNLILDKLKLDYYLECLNLDIQIEHKKLIKEQKELQNKLSLMTNLYINSQKELLKCKEFINNIYFKILDL